MSSFLPPVVLNRDFSTEVLMFVYHYLPKDDDVKLYFTAFSDDVCNTLINPALRREVVSLHLTSTTCGHASSPGLSGQTPPEEKISTWSGRADNLMKEEKTKRKKYAEDN